MKDWLFFFVFVGAGLTVTLFMRFVWPKIRQGVVGDRHRWALQNGYLLDRGDQQGFLQSIGRPGLFAHETGSAETVLRGQQVSLVDFTFVVTHTDSSSGSWTERRLVTVAVGDVGRDVPSTRVVPRTLTIKLSEALAFAPIETGDAEFDAAFHVDANTLGGMAARLVERRTGATISPDAATDESAVRALFSPLVRSRMRDHSKMTFEFDGRYLLVYQQWRLVPDRRLGALVECWTELQTALSNPSPRP